MTTDARPGTPEFQRALQKFNEFNFDPLRKLTSYGCPACGEVNIITRPRRRELSPGRTFWDMLRACGDCGDMHFTKVYTNGDVTAVSTCGASIDAP